MCLQKGEGWVISLVLSPLVPAVSIRKVVANNHVTLYTANESKTCSLEEVLQTWACAKLEGINRNEKIMFKNQPYSLKAVPECL